jgi:hypothetical protein
LGYGNFRYFITFVDDFSRFLTIFFLKSKSDALQCFTRFRTAAERQLSYQIVYLRVDNAGELTEGDFRNYCNTEGITYEKTVPDASQQNGVAERVNQIIERMSRAMLVDSGLSNWFWPLSAQAGVHIKNRVPHSSLSHNTTPFSLWFNKKPDLSHLRPFGSLVTTRKTNSDQLNKVEPRGEQGRFVGYSNDSRGYLIWLPDSKAIRSRRDVEFHGFPNHLKSPPLSDILWDDLRLDSNSMFNENPRFTLERNSLPSLGDKTEYVYISRPFAEFNFPSFSHGPKTSRTSLDHFQREEQGCVFIRPCNTLIPHSST